MIRIKVVYYLRKDEFTLFLRVTDGEEPILMTKDFNLVMAKIEDLRRVIPQTGSSEVIYKSIDL